MTKKTQYLVAASVSILLVGSTAGGLAYYGYLGRVLQPGAPDDLRYVPRGVDAVACVDVRAVMNSALRQQLRQLERDEAQGGRREFRDRTGIDLETDVDRVVVYEAPGSGSQPESPGGLVLARGRFDQKRIEALVREGSGVIEDYHGRRIMMPRPDRPGRGDNPVPNGQPPATDPPREMALTFMEAGLVALGSPTLVRGTIDLNRGGPNITQDQEFMRLVRDVDQGDAWAVGRMEMLTSRMKTLPGLTGKIPPLRFFTVTGRVNGGVSGRLQAEAADEASAQQLRDVVRGFVALAKLQAGSRPEFQTMLNSLELAGTGRTVSLSFSFAPEAIEALGRSGGGRSGGGRRPLAPPQ
jgi:hypothetical protein